MSVLLLTILISVATAQQQGAEFKKRYVALTESWVRGIEFTPEETSAMLAGKQVEELMMKGPDDPLARRIMAAGEPSWAAVSAAYPGKILDRTVLGSYSDPRLPLGKFSDEFSIYWNGAIAANLKHGRLTNALGATGTLPLGHNTVVEFRVGSNAELPGRVRGNYSSIGYERGYLPIVTSTYDLDGVRYRQTSLAWKHEEGWDVAHVAFEITNTSKVPRPAALFAQVILTDGSAVQFRDGNAFDDKNALLLTASTGAAIRDSRLHWRFDLGPGQSRNVFFKIPYLPDSANSVKRPSPAEFEAVHGTAVSFWQGLLDKGARIETPEPRVNHVWRALLLQNFVLADGPKFTYGSGLRYNDSTYPQENGFGTHVFAMFGYKEYANTLQEWFPQMCVTPEGAGRKYQNRRAMVLHHLLENYRLTGFTDLYDRHKADYHRIAEDIISERKSTMVEKDGKKPMHWGLLPPDKPGVDVQASTQTVYVLGHNITNCQGLMDFGRFLTVTGIDRIRGERYVREASDFREAILQAMTRAAIRIPGRPPFVDLQTLYFRETPDYGPEPYDDLGLGRLQGAYFHYWVDMQLHYNFFNPGDEVAQWLTDYVQQRNGFALGLTRARPVSGALGWVNNVYDGGYYNHRLRRGEIAEFLLGFYSKLAFGMSRYTYVASEGSPFIGYNTEAGGFVGADYSFPNSAANADTLLMLRNSLVMEELRNNVETGTLQLLKGAPLAWMEPGKMLKVTRLATYYGDISFVTEGLPQGFRVTVQPPAGAWSTFEVSLRRPLKSVTVNGAKHTDFDSSGLVRIKRVQGPLKIEASY
jgi:hypothetical protein